MKSPQAKGRIECPDFSGRVGAYDAKAVRFRPAAYGLLRHEGRILMTRSRFTGLWDFPGGGVEPFEWLSDGLAREFFEETGVQVTVGPLIYVAEGYIAMFGHPFHSLRFYYVCEPAEDIGELMHDPGEVSELVWWRLDEAPWDRMHASDQEALKKVLS